MLYKLVCRTLYIINAVILLYLITAFFAQATPIYNVFINEIHYDNSGTDSNEFVELSGSAGTNLLGWSLHFYNGSNGENYKNYLFNSNWILENQQNNFGFAAVNISGIQNGTSGGYGDGIALVDPHDNIIQFLSYESSFKATDGIADGMESDDIGVFESSLTPANFSLQLSGIGEYYQDFTWTNAKINSFGSVNAEQQFSSKVIEKQHQKVRVSEPNSFYLLLAVMILLFNYKSFQHT